MKKRNDEKFNEEELKKHVLEAFQMLLSTTILFYHLENYTDEPLKTIYHDIAKELHSIMDTLPERFPERLKNLVSYEFI